MRSKWIQAIIFLCTLAPMAQADGHKPRERTTTINYDFVSTDIAVPSGRPGQVAFAEDIDDDGTLIGNVPFIGVVIDPASRRKPAFTVNCGADSDTNATAISSGRIAGSCLVMGKDMGFVRDRGGDMNFLDFPGADGTEARGLRGDNVVGQFFGPLCQGVNCPGALSYRFHGFRWNRLTNQFSQIDFPAPNTFVDIVNINSQGQILGRYVIVDLENNTLEAGWFIYDNGLFDLPFPLDHSDTGGDTIFVTDINDDGQAILIRRIAGEVKIQLFDDGTFFDITGFPVNWIPINVRGMNNRAQFVGSYCVMVPDPIHPPFKTCEFHGFVASPTSTHQAKNDRHR